MPLRSRDVRIECGQRLRQEAFGREAAKYSQLEGMPPDVSEPVMHRREKANAALRLVPRMPTGWTASQDPSPADATTLGILPKKPRRRSTLSASTSRRPSRLHPTATTAACSPDVTPPQSPQSATSPMSRAMSLTSLVMRKKRTKVKLEVAESLSATRQPHTCWDRRPSSAELVGAVCRNRLREMAEEVGTVCTAVARVRAERMSSMTARANEECRRDGETSPLATDRSAPDTPTRQDDGASAVVEGMQEGIEEVVEALGSARMLRDAVLADAGQGQTQAGGQQSCVQDVRQPRPPKRRERKRSPLRRSAGRTSRAVHEVLTKALRGLHDAAAAHVIEAKYRSAVRELVASRVQVTTQPPRRQPPSARLRAVCRALQRQRAEVKAWDSVCSNLRAEVALPTSPRRLLGWGSAEGLFPELASAWSCLLSARAAKQKAMGQWATIGKSARAALYEEEAKGRNGVEVHARAVLREVLAEYNKGAVEAKYALWQRCWGQHGEAKRASLLRQTAWAAIVKLVVASGPTAAEAERISRPRRERQRLRELLSRARSPLSGDVDGDDDPPRAIRRYARVVLCANRLYSHILSRRTASSAIVRFTRAVNDALRFSKAMRKFKRSLLRVQHFILFAARRRRIVQQLRHLVLRREEDRVLCQERGLVHNGAAQHHQPHQPHQPRRTLRPSFAPVSPLATVASLACTPPVSPRSGFRASISAHSTVLAIPENQRLPYAARQRAVELAVRRAEEEYVQERAIHRERLAVWRERQELVKHIGAVQGKGVAQWMHDPPRSPRPVHLWWTLTGSTDEASEARKAKGDVLVSQGRALQREWEESVWAVAQQSGGSSVREAVDSRLEDRRRRGEHTMHELWGGRNSIFGPLFSWEAPLRRWSPPAFMPRGLSPRAARSPRAQHVASLRSRRGSQQSLPPMALE